jgi:hypothetical protein
MGKRIDELMLDDSPIQSPDPRETEWQRFSRDIEELRGSGAYHWAESTLAGIQETVEKTKRVTDGQRRAVTNIEAARGRGGSRRYEGFRGRW